MTVKLSSTRTLGVHMSPGARKGQMAAMKIYSKTGQLGDRCPCDVAEGDRAASERPVRHRSIKHASSLP